MRIEITLNSNTYAIDVEGNCFTAIKFGKNQKTGAVTENQLGYFNNLSNAALRLCREEISRSPDIVSLKGFAFRVESINNELLAQLDLIAV